MLETVPVCQPPAAWLSGWPPRALPSLCLQQPGRSPSGILRFRPACFFARLLGLQRPMEEERKLKPMMPGIVQAGGAATDARALGTGRLALPPRALPAVPGQRLGVCAPSARPPRPRLSVESRGAFQMGAEREPLLRGLAWSKARVRANAFHFCFSFSSFLSTLA